MAYDEEVAARVRALVASREGFTERKMFGGLCFMLYGNMFAGVVRDELMLRVGKAAFDGALKRQGAKPMDFTGRPMAGMVFIEPQGFASRDGLQAWLDDALSYVETLPPKSAKTNPKRLAGRDG